MRPQRQVRRAGMRPTYTRRQAATPRRPLKLPTVRFAWIRLGALAVVALVIIIVLGQLTALKHIRIQGNHSLTTAHVDQLVHQGVSKQLFGGNLILLDTGSLAAYLEKTDPAIKQATIQQHFLHTLTVTIVERQPALNWQTNGTVYLLDSNATVIGPTDSTYAHLPTVTDSSNLPVKAGDRVAPTGFVAFCVEIAQQLPAAGYTIQGMTVPESTSEVYVQTAGGVLLKFDTTRPAAEEVSDLKAVQAELKAANATPTAYIDLRIPHKAYYK